MEVTEMSLANVWLFLIGFFLLYYVMTDGFDLGVGILSLFAGDDDDRGTFMKTLDSVWHLNQTWLAILGGMLFGAFPLFYSILLSSLYIPMVVMLVGLIFRGVAFEFRSHSQHKFVWELSFGLGSLTATMAQGFALGGLISGLDVKNGQFVGSVWSWFNPFSALIAAGVLFGYTMLGANYLILKTKGKFQERSFWYSLIASSSTFLISLAVHLWTVARYPRVAQKWGVSPDFIYLSLFSLLALFAFVMLFRSLRKRREVAPLLWNYAVIICSFVGLSVGLYPEMIPNVSVDFVTVKAAAASPKTLLFMTLVMVVLLPVILFYTAYTYRVFRGKVTEAEYGYEDGASGIKEKQ